MKLSNQKGFTLIELVLVITILGILAIAALPAFIDVTSDAATSARDGVVGSVREGIDLQYAQTLVDGAAAWPTLLDDSTATAVGDCATGNPCFAGEATAPILQHPITDNKWSVITVGTVYKFDNSGVTTCHTYDPTGGSFDETTCP